MFGKGRLRGSAFFGTVQEILSNYSCPSTCPAICCKVADINLDEEDLKILRQELKDMFSGIEPCNDGGELHYKIHPPCPFLENDRCSIYESRPAICRMFPFNITTMPDVLLLFPCDMGASIFRDYVKYSDNILKKPVPTTTIEAFEQSHSSFEIKLNRNLPVPMLVLRIHDLVSFKEYLVSGSV